MSILLDAVSRSQQQQGDLLSSPRPLYEEPKSGLPLANLWLPAALVLAIASAWGVNHFLNGTVDATADVNANVTAEGAYPGVAQVESRLPAAESAQVGLVGEVTQQPAKLMPHTAEADTGVRLAGKVALPLSRNWQSPNALVAVEASSQELESLAAPEQTATADGLKLAEEPSVTDEEPIILGAGANQRGLEALAALKQEVASAAAEVGLSQVQEKARPRVADAELVSAFQAALKEVEFDKSANTSVTEPKLDPIPAPKKDYPKYGELPAALQLRVPEFNINAHVYATAPNNRWLNVDGAELQQGDKIKGLLTIVEIRPRDVVLSIEGTEFKVPAI
ncbi:general secretion pathway protein GspB [Shewanella sedimentimangrovi]|uniref:General secretion pathway protein GspB n=1 Tax=Shewanella sedimentimangrovi TaxID=2814293 RepID=A0ABX7R2F8_9GAMM|nr:general secretion pathway protein GspB [Shewanella sedimentimangrovi]QSX38007.1 general secretion pathway protein GspB [Shewanella sedimentimangrovi]